MIINNIDISLESLTHFSSAYKKGLIELNISALAKKLNGIGNKTTRNKKIQIIELTT